MVRMCADDATRAIMKPSPLAAHRALPGLGWDSRHSSAWAPGGFQVRE